MSTIASTSLINGHNSLLRLSMIGGIITGLLHLVVQVGIVYDLLLKSPFIGTLQYLASGAVGNAAFTGVGIARPVECQQRPTVTILRIGEAID